MLYLLECVVILLPPLECVLMLSFNASISVSCDFWFASVLIRIARCRECSIKDYFISEKAGFCNLLRVASCEGQVSVCIWVLSNFMFPAIPQCLWSPSVKSGTTAVDWWRLSTGSTTSSWCERTATYLAQSAFQPRSPWWPGVSPPPPESSSLTPTPVRCLTLTYHSLAPATNTSPVAVSSSLY